MWRVPGGSELSSSRNTIITVAVFVLLGLGVVGGSIYYYVKSTANPDTATGEPGSSSVDLSGAGAGPATVATFAGKPISRQEYEAAWREFLTRGGASEDDIPIVSYLGARYDALMQLISDRIIEEGMREFNVQITEDDKRQAVEMLAAREMERRHGSQEALAYFLDAQGKTAQTYLDEIADEILGQNERQIEEQVRAVKVGRKVAEDVNIEPERLGDYLRLVDILRITQLFEPVEPGAAVVPEEQAEATIREAYQKLQGGEAFESLVSEYSNGPEKENGGRIDGLRYGSEPVFDGVAWSLQSGQVSEPFKTNTGWHIIKILQFHEQPMPENEQERAELRGRLEAAIAEQRTAKWMVERFEQGNLQIEDPVLAGVDAMREARFEEAKTHLESALSDRTGIDRLPILSSLGQVMFELDDHDRTEKIHEEMMDLALERHRFELYVDWAAFRIAIDDREGGLEKLRQASEAADSPDDHIELAQVLTSIDAREAALEELALVRASIPEPTEEMPPEQQGASYTQLVTLAVVHGRLGFEEQGKAQLRALIKDTYSDGLLRAVAEAAAELGWEDVFNEVQARVQQLIAETGSVRDMVEGQDAAPAPAPSDAPQEAPQSE
jgi:parvulin-like peptidyl-prolyl isomerase